MIEFSPGRVVGTQEIVNAIEDDANFRTFCSRSLQRHLAGDWGDLSENDRQANHQALDDGGQLLSAYVYATADAEGGQRKIWIISGGEDDDGIRQSTTILFPHEY